MNLSLRFVNCSSYVEGLVLGDIVGVVMLYTLKVLIIRVMVKLSNPIKEAVSEWKTCKSSLSQFLTII